MAVVAWFGRRIVLASISLAAILVLGLAGTWALGERGRNATNSGYVRAARTAAASFAAGDIRGVTAAAQELGTPAYDSIRQRLERIRRANPDARFVYLMIMREGTVSFLADAEPPESPDASQPGDLYPEASAALLEAFATGEPFIEGPLTDRWGEWITGFAPVLEEESGAVLAMLGIDWDARNWRATLAIYYWLGLALTVFPLLLATAIFIGLVRAERINLMLTEEMKERRLIQAELERLSKQDPLTGVANRRTFDMMFDLEWRRALRAQLPVSLIMIDVDEFKAYNDQNGHQAGDEALQRIAGAIRTAVKRAGDEPVRYGGEEFAVILPAADAEGAFHVAEEIRREVEQQAIVRDAKSRDSYLTVSIGVATVSPTTNDVPAVLVFRADQALYHAKAAGRNIVKSDVT